MTPKAETQDEITGLRDLSPEQREDIEAMCDEGMMPSQIGRRLGIPTQVVADARRAWRRQKELDEKTTAPTSVAPTMPTSAVLGDLMAMTQQQLQTTLLQAQIDAMLEQNRHRKEANKLEERERRLEIAEREATFRDEFTPAQPANDTISDYDFENNPLGAAAQFMKDLKQANDTPRDAIGSPQTNDVAQTAKELTEEDIAAFAAKQPPEIIGKAIAAVDTPYQSELEAVLVKNGVSHNNVPRVVDWLRREKKRRAGVKK